MSAQAVPARRGRALMRVIPALVFAAIILGWEALVRLRGIPPYILPAPSLIAQTLVADWGTLAPALWMTLRTTFLALLLATVGGLALALLFARWRIIEASLFPIAVILQVTPIIAIAPLLLVAILSSCTKYMAHGLRKNCGSGACRPHCPIFSAGFGSAAVLR